MDTESFKLLKRTLHAEVCCHPYDTYILVNTVRENETKVPHTFTVIKARNIGASQFKIDWNRINKIV